MHKTKERSALIGLVGTTTYNVLLDGMATQFTSGAYTLCLSLDASFPNAMWPLGAGKVQ